MSGQMAEEPGAIVLSARRKWSEAEKQAILSEAAAGKTSVSEVARRHGLARDLLFRWRREERAKAGGTQTQSGFVAIALPPPASAARPGSIEIVLGNGRRVVVGGDVDVSALKRVIEALEANPVHRSSQSEGG
jgi:transposase